MKPEEASWLAALLDSEGTISLTKSHNKIFYKSRPSRRGFSWNMRIHITNNSIPFLKRAQELAGGKMIENHVQPSHMNTNSKPWNNLFFDTVEQRTLLDVIIPFLIIKRHHAELFLEARNLLEAYRGLGPIMELTDIRDKRLEAIYWELRLLNAKGKDGIEKVQKELSLLPENPRLYMHEMFEADIKKTEEELEQRKLIVRHKHSNKWKKNNAMRIKAYNEKYYAEHKAELNDPAQRREEYERLKKRLEADHVLAERYREKAKEATRRYREKQKIKETSA